MWNRKPNKITGSRPYLLVFFPKIPKTAPPSEGKKLKAFRTKLHKTALCKAKMIKKLNKILKH